MGMTRRGSSITVETTERSGAVVRCNPVFPDRVAMVLARSGSSTTVETPERSAAVVRRAVSSRVRRPAAATPPTRQRQDDAIGTPRASQHLIDAIETSGASCRTRLSDVGGE